jgi:hypothetical protein
VLFGDRHVLARDLRISVNSIWRKFCRTQTLNSGMAHPFTTDMDQVWQLAQAGNLGDAAVIMDH